MAKSEKAGLSVSMRPDEIVVGDVVISIKSPVALDAEQARRGIGVSGVDGLVRVEDGGRHVVWRPRNPLAPGRYTLVVGELASLKGKSISQEETRRFTVVSSRARVSSSVAVESMVRLRIQGERTQRLSLFEQPSGSFIDVIKGSRRETGAPVALAFDQRGKPVDSDKLLAQVEVARVRRYGKLHPSLARALQKAGEKTRLPVAVWMTFDSALLDTPRSTKAQRKAPSSARRQQVAIEKATATGTRLLHSVDAKTTRVSRGAPVLFTQLTSAGVAALAKNDAVAGLFLHDATGIDDLVNSMAIANSDDVHALGVRGRGIRVAVWENGPDDTTNLAIADRFRSNPTTSEHSRHVHGIIRNTESGQPRGHARACSLHSANDKDLDGLDWAVNDEECTVINQSFHRSEEPEEGTLSFDDIYKDWLALRWPYPTICQAAGNFWNTDPDDIDPPSDEFVNHKGYNSLAVGNHNDDATGMSSDSVFRNPTSTHGDRELPELSANGTSVTTVGLTKGGTSMASPACAGVAALIQQTDSTLEHWPEGCRAILLAGATRNVVANTWWNDVSSGVDASDGSGAVNALESHHIAKSRRGRNLRGIRRGWDIGSLSSSDFDGSGLSAFSYRVAVPSFVFGPRNVKVVLAWTSKVDTFSILGFTIPITSRLTVDLDLKIFDAQGNQVGYSGSWDNSYEIAEFVGKPGETYDIRVRRWSGTDQVWYGLAWTVTGGISLLTAVQRGELVIQRP